MVDCTTSCFTGVVLPYTSFQNLLYICSSASAHSVPLFCIEVARSLLYSDSSVGDSFAGSTISSLICFSIDAFCHSCFAVSVIYDSSFVFTGTFSFSMLSKSATGFLSKILTSLGRYCFQSITSFSRPLSNTISSILPN